MYQAITCRENLAYNIYLYTVFVYIYTCKMLFSIILAKYCKNFWQKEAERIGLKGGISREKGRKKSCKN